MATWFLQSSFTTPAYGSTGVAQLTDASNMWPGMLVSIEDGSAIWLLEVVSVSPSSSKAVLINRPTSLISAPGHVFPIGTPVSSEGMGIATATTSGNVPTPPNSTTQFLRGDATWATSNLVASTTASFTVPAIGSSQAISITTSAWLTVGQTVFISDGINLGFYEITVVTNSTSITIINRGYKGNVAGGVTMASGSPVILYGPGLASSTQPGFCPTITGTTTFTTASFTVPAAHATVAGVTISSVTWPLVGQKIYITDGTLLMYGNITAVASATSITVRNTGDIGNSVSGTMSLGASVVLVGFQTPMFRQWQAALEYSPPATLYAVFGVQNARAHLAFNDAAAWTANFYGVVPAGTYLGAGITVRLKWKSITTERPAVAVWGASIERLNTAESADSFDTQTLNTTTGCSSTQSALVESVIGPFTTIDGLTAGDGFGLQIQRLGANGSDLLAGDACLRTVSIESVV